MRVVTLPRDHVDIQPIARGDPERIVDEAGDDALEEDLAGELVAEVLVRPRPVVLVDGVDPLEEVGDPSDAAFAQGKGEVRKLAEQRGPHEVGGGLHDIDRLQRDEGVHWRLDRGDDHLRRRADVQAHDHVLVAAGLPEWIPVLVVNRRVAELLGVLRERDRVAPFSGHASDLGGHLVDVPNRG